MNPCIITPRSALKYCAPNQKYLKQFTVPMDLNLFPQRTHQGHFHVIQSFNYASWGMEKNNQLKAFQFHQWKSLYSKYEEFVGLTDVQNAQLEVKRTEENFLKARAEERSIMRDVLEIRDKLKHVRERLSHVNYSNPLYPQLANEQHELVTQEEKIKIALDAVEEKERDAFHMLSGAVRDSYEKERERVERTKNWSLIGSVIGTVLGMLGSSYINRVRTNDLKKMIEERDHNQEIKESISQVVPHADEQYNDIKEEIKQLQVCLINKLLESPAEHKSTEEARSDDSILKSINKVLQSFQHQLTKLSEQSHENKSILTEQSDTVRKELKNLSVDEIHVSIKDELSKIRQNLERIRRSQAASGALHEENSNSHDMSGNSEENVEVTAWNNDNASTESSVYRSLERFVLWGVVMTTVCYIVRV